jgi:hypothetical protein
LFPAFNRPDSPKKVPAFASFPELGPKVKPISDDNPCGQNGQVAARVGSTQPFTQRRVQVRVSRTAGA